MILRKWNYKNHDYDDYKIPDEWNCKTFTVDMKEIVNCPHCGKELSFGETYCSKELHTHYLGFGYGVCKECYQEEWERYNNETNNN